MTTKRLCLALSAALALSQPAMAGGISRLGLPTPVINGDCVIGSGGVAIWGSCAGGSTGFPIVVGSTSIASGSTTTTLAGLTLTTPTINGAALSGTVTGSATFSAAQQFAAGTVSAPGIALGEAATGLYYGASHSIYFTENGAFAGFASGGEWLLSSSTAGAKAMTNGTVTPLLNIAQNNATSGQNGMAVTSYRAAATANPGTYYCGFAKTSTIGNFTTTASGDQLCQVLAEGADGTKFQDSSQILFSAGGAVSTGIVPGQVDIKTATTAGAMTEAVKIDDAQQMTLPAIATATGEYVCSTSGLLSQEATACPASDERVKHDLVPLEWPMGSLMHMRTERFTYNAGKGAPGRRIGVIAQDWQKDFPELVSHDPDGTLHFDYNGGVAVLVAAVKQQQWEIVALVGWNVLLTAGFFILWRRRA